MMGEEWEYKGRVSVSVVPSYVSDVPMNERIYLGELLLEVLPTSPYEAVILESIDLDSPIVQTIELESAFIKVIELEGVI